MRVRELQAMLNAKYPGAWNVQRNKTGFCAVRVDSVELIDVTELASIASRARTFQVYATMEPRTEWSEDGVYFALWFIPHKPLVRPSRQRRNRKR